MNEFEREVADRIDGLGKNDELKSLAASFMLASTLPKYSYNFAWQGRPIIQYPQDIVAMQELIWSVKPDLIIETGIAHGGSLILSASMLALLDMSDAIVSGRSIDPRVSARKVVGVDIDIRSHNRAAVESHPMSSRIQMIEGPSAATEVVAQVREIASHYQRIMVCLDSNHTHAHVLDELNAYADLTSVGSYCVVFDTIIEHFPKKAFPDRSWGPGDNPKTAVRDFLQTHPEFVVDQAIDNKLLMSVAPGGYLKRMSA